MSSIFQKLFGPAQSQEQGKMIDDELPVNDPDELAVEEEFKNKAAAPQPPSTPQPPTKQAPRQPVTESRPAAPPPPPPNRPKPAPATPPAAQPSRPPQKQVGSPDMDRLRNLAKSSGLSTSMDSIGQSGNVMTFDIEVMEEGEDGRPMVHVERGVSASSEAELRGLYAMSDQKIRIIRKYGEQAQQPPQPVQQQVQVAPPPSVTAPSVTPVVEKTVEPPKYFNVSGVECKLENGKVYQRQWVRLAGADAEAFRLVNDTNNKIVPIDGKHIEQKKWVLIQENADEGE